MTNVDKNNNYLKNIAKKITPKLIRVTVWNMRHVSFAHGLNFFLKYCSERFTLFLDDIRGNRENVDCNCCGRSFGRFVQFIGYDFLPGSARCPSCNSLARHRFLRFYLDKEVLHRYDDMTILRFSPEGHFDMLMGMYPQFQYLRTDIDSLKYSDKNNFFVSDAQSIPLRSGSVDIVVSVHVLEHLPDDLIAIQEIARVLTQEGTAFLMVPQTSSPHTLEFGAPQPKEHYHYRRYGSDFVDRITSVFEVSVIGVSSHYPEHSTEFGSEKIFMCKKKSIDTDEVKGEV